MNEGASLDELLQQVRAPAELLERPWLRPIYDEPEFIVRNIWRLYGGWWDGNPAHLKPAPDAELARELAGARRRRRAAGGPREGAGRGPGSSGWRRTWPSWRRRPSRRAERRTRRVPRSYERRAGEAEASTMARGIFAWAAGESRRALERRTRRERRADRRRRSGLLALTGLADLAAPARASAGAAALGFLGALVLGLVAADLGARASRRRRTRCATPATRSAAGPTR